MFARSSTRDRVNRRYQGFSSASRWRFYRFFAKAYRNGSSQAEPGSWRVEFAGRTISMPLRSERMWLDWDNALSIAGHDIEVKQTYAGCLRSPVPPEVFLDIGANYGLHSLLFLAHGVNTITFEPNPSCREDFQAICELNALTPRIEGVALGDRPGEVELTYPERETWLGTIHAAEAHGEEWEAAAKQGLRVQRVPLRMVDDYLDELSGRRVLIKVDTEGSEVEVLSGATRTLDDVRPLIVFETFLDSDRRRLQELFDRHGYGIARLPWDPAGPTAYLEEGAFLSSSGENFIAVPRT